MLKIIARFKIKQVFLTTMAFGKFDKSLDKELFSETINFETTRIRVGVFSYNDGEKKMQVSRENMSQNGEWSFAKLGRLFKDEAEKVIPVMEKALKYM